MRLNVRDDPLATEAERAMIARPMSDDEWADWLDAGARDPRPAVTAYPGYQGDAYFRDGSTWVHCLDGTVWEA